MDKRHWLTPEDFERAIAATSLLPGPGSTQMAIYCAWRVAGVPGAFVGGLAFIVPAVVMILALSVAFLSGSPPDWLRGAGDGAGAAVPIVAIAAAASLAPPIWARAAGDSRVRVVGYAIAGGIAAALAAPFLVIVLLACGVVELAVRRRAVAGFVPWLPFAVTTGGWGALAWTAFKVGALSFGGGFVIIPLMQGDAVHVYHWMTDSQFLNAVALGQVTPGPVVATVSAVGYAAHGLLGGVLAAVVAFAPSFTFILIGANRFQRLLGNDRVRYFLGGAAPAAVGAIAGAAIPLTTALGEGWQFAILGAAAVAMLWLRVGVVVTLVGAGVIGAIVVLAGAPVPN